MIKHLINIFANKNNNKFNNECRKGIFLMHEGLPRTITESQVLSYVRTTNNDQIQMEVWTFSVSKNNYQSSLNLTESLNQKHGVKIRIFRGVKPDLPLSTIFNSLLLLYWLIKLQYSPNFVHARTEYSATVASNIKNIFRFILIWDARGDSLSEFEDAISSIRMPHRLLAPFKSHAIRKRIKIAAKECDRACFVSDALRELQGSNLSSSQTFVTPCLADESLFNYNKKLRNEIRAHLGYSENDIILVYSGSTAAWQCVPETITLISQAIESNHLFRALILTSHPDKFEDLIPKKLRNNFSLHSCELHDVNGFLNAADIGVMLRADNSINRVASPVKFAEYSLSGLQVITTSSVQQAYNFGKLIGNIIDPTEFLQSKDKLFLLSSNRESRAQRAVEYYGRHNHIEKIRGIYMW